MAQFDVYENINEQTKSLVPYLLDVQHDILKNLSTRVVVPLVLNKKSIKNLTPIFDIKENSFVMNTSQIAGVPIESLGNKVFSLKDKRDEIIGAIDFLITGF